MNENGILVEMVEFEAFDLLFRHCELVQHEPFGNSE